jgi:hypothetical protein
LPRVLGLRGFGGKNDNIMNNWFTVKVKYTKQLDNGALKRVTEQHLFAAMTHTDAEARAHEELGQMIRGDFDVIGISPAKIHDIFAYDDSDIYYKCKVKYEKFGEVTETTKSVTQTMLTSANNVKEAYERMQESLSGLMVDFEIPSIVVSPIVEVFPYKEELDKELSRRPTEEVEQD